MFKKGINSKSEKGFFPLWSLVYHGSEVKLLPIFASEETDIREDFCEI